MSDIEDFLMEDESGEFQSMDEVSSDDGFADEENTAPNVPNQRTKGGKPKTIEETFQKKTQKEHILLRPDSYIGSVMPQTERMFVLDGEEIVEKEITFTPGLYKIFDEILVNAADNKQRDPNMDRIEITIEPEANLVTIKNNGKGIPVVWHKKENMYVPEMIFGHLLTGSNFDDGEEKTVGGRNGFGAKLCNLFSTQFILECVDTENGQYYKQVFRKNMEVIDKPIVKKCTAAQTKKGDFVMVKFSPELSRFQMTSLDDDTVSLLSKRAYDIAGTMARRNGKKLSVWLNGKRLSVGSFKEYLAVFRNISKPVAYENLGDWEVAVAPSADNTMTHVSFVNAISTSKGGGHVNYILDQVASHLQNVLKKKNKKGPVVKPNVIKQHLAVYVNCLVVNPSFDSQTKDFLTTKSNSFKEKCKLSDGFLKKTVSISENIMRYVAFKEQAGLKRKGGTKKLKLTGIGKLDDANFAGGAKGVDCTLIITEGDSAKSLAVSGLSVVGRDYYGVFPLRGKPMNVRDAPTSQVVKNEEIKNLVDILGLKFEQKYETDADLKKLRYGHLMIMADQDTDGSHIKGLVINFLHKFWPSLLDRPGFLQQFITPIVKATKGKTTKTFFNLPEYLSWHESLGPSQSKGWKIKYYKGLGTSTSQEAKEYFSNLDTHEVTFACLDDDKIEPCEGDELENALPNSVRSGNDLIDMVFKKDRVQDRKHWLNNSPTETFLDYSQAPEDGVSYSEFLNKEYILFSRYDNVRSIPHLIDGFKPSQRKVLFGCFKRKLKAEVKVAQLTGYIAEHSAYHHGEASLQGTIVNMAQNFVGSNNINLLTPAGQFGTRRMGGKDSASPRYIFTKLEKITRAIFHPDDDEILTYLKDDGQDIEPEFYVPVIPMVLCNGSDGIGTGWSSTVLNYDPRKVIANLRKCINGEELDSMDPHYYGFTGDIEPTKPGSFSANGRISRVNDTTLAIDELPLKKWTQDYKQFLEKMLGDSKKPGDIKDFKENHTDTTVSFTITCDKEQIDKFESGKGGLMAKFKLTASLQTTNMNLFNEEGRITKYQDPRDILFSFYELRLEYYGKRKELLVDKLKTEQRKLSNKARFVDAVCNGELVVSQRKKVELLAELKAEGYETFMPAKKSTDDKGDSDSDEDEDIKLDQMSHSDLAKGYEYLLGMKIWSLTFEHAEHLRAELAEKTKTLVELEATSPAQIWLNDLDAIETALDERDAEFEESMKEEAQAQKKNSKRRTKAKAKAKPKRVVKKSPLDWDSDMEEEEDDDGDDSSVEILPKKVPAKKAAVKRAPAPVKRAQAKRAPAKQAQSKLTDEHFEIETTPSEDLVETMEVSLHVSPQPKKQEATKKRTASPVLEDSSQSESEPAKTTGARARKASGPTKAVARNPAARKKVDSDSDLEFKSSDDESMKSICAKPAAARRVGRARKPVVYAIDDSDDSDDSYGSD